MKIFLTVSKTGVSEFNLAYEEILKELERQGSRVEATFSKSYLNSTPKLKTVKNLASSEEAYRFAHDKAVRQAIFRADAVVIEASYPSFRLGFEAFIALSRQKPVLVLSKFHNYGHLIDQPNFFGAKYTDFTLPDEIGKFLRHVKKHKLRNRFNLFISDDHKRQIAEGAKRYNVSMSDYLRRLIEIDKS